jgi:hypothetical protein
VDTSAVCMEAACGHAGGRAQRQVPGDEKRCCKAAAVNQGARDALMWTARTALC